jgi:hypothetical protein
VDGWKRNFVDKLGKAQAQCTKRFEEALNSCVAPVFEELSGFLRDNGFRVSTPLQEPGRRSFKFELAENAYLLLLFRFTAIGEFELRSEMFVPGCEPQLKKSIGRIGDVEQQWTQEQFRTGLDRFVDLLGGNASNSEISSASPKATKSEGGAEASQFDADMEEELSVV